MKPENEFYVISNTHWDREWRFPFERTRAMLVEMMDRLLDLLDNCDGFRYFHLDAHTVMLEDYLEIRPEKRDQLMKHVRDGRLLVGPWYTLPDSCSCSGEALVRNLLRGHQQAEEFGKVTKVGYTPNGFGQPSQLPQLYDGFGIDTILFYRGVPRHEVKSEFIWEGPDGTRAYAFRFGKYARYNFFFLVYRPTIHNRKAFECEYKWEEGSLPFRLDRDLSYEPYYLLDFKPKFDKSQILPGLEEMLEVDADNNTTPIIMAMQGCDSTAPDDMEIRIIEEANRQLGEQKVFHGSMEEVVEKIKALAPENLDEVKGEMRSTLHSGGQTDLYPAIYGCRVYLRQANAFSEVNLEDKAEPAAAMAWLLGEEYPKGLLNLAWKLLLHNHAHDSVGGCSMDRVHEDVMNRYARCDDISYEILRMSLAKTALHLDTSDLPSDAVLLLAVNPQPHSRSEVISAAVDIPVDAASENIEVFTLDGTKLASQVDCTQELRPTVQKPNDIPSPYHAVRHHIQFEAPEIPAMGWKAFIVKPADAAPEVEQVANGSNELENEYLKVSVYGDGTFTLTDKETGKTFSSLHYYESESETGDPWNRMTAEVDKKYTSKGGNAEIKLLSNGPMAASIEISITMQLPEGVLPDRSKRSENLVDYPIRTVLTLKKGSRVLDVKTTVNNVAKDHRLRLLLPTDMNPEFSWGHMPFDVVKRPVNVPSGEGWLEPPTGTHPQKWFVDVSDGKNGLAVINQGITQYEVVETEEHPIAMTFMRCFQSRNSVQNIDYPDQPDTQCQGVQEFRYALYPHAGDYDDGAVAAQASRWQVQPVICQVGTNKPANGPALPPEYSFFELNPDALMFSGMKPAEDGESLIVRFYNPTERTIDAEFKSKVPLASAVEARLDETPIRNLDIDADSKIKVAGIGPKKVVTLKLKKK